MLAAIFIITVLAGLSGLLLAHARSRFKVEGNPLADRINQTLPQTQCGQCGFAGCRPYAESIAEGGSEINLCPPGGEIVITELAEILGRDASGLKQAEAEYPENSVAVIIEQDCIGCTKCIQACPVDAIVGMAKQMHTVILDECTGCALCLPPCPVDCIDMLPRPEVGRSYPWQLPCYIERQQDKESRSCDVC